MIDVVQRRLALFFTILLLRAPATPAQVLSDEVGALRGLAGVYIMGGDADDIMAGRGIVKEDVLNVVTMRLHDGGVPVLDETGWLMEESAPVLYIDLTWNAQDDLLVYSVRLEVLYLVNPLSETEMTAYAVIWGEGRLGILGDSASDRILDDLQHLADKLSNDYAASNS